MQTLHKNSVVVGDSIHQGRATARPYPFGRRQVLYGVRKSVHPSHRLAARHLRIAIGGQLEQPIAILQRHNRIYFGIDPRNVIEICSYDLAAGNSLRVNGLRQLHPIHHHDRRSGRRRIHHVASNQLTGNQPSTDHTSGLQEITSRSHGFSFRHSTRNSTREGRAQDNHRRTTHRVVANALLAVPG